MGQCMSRKAAGAFAASAAAAHNRPGKMHKHAQLQQSPGNGDDNKTSDLLITKKPPLYNSTKGVATSFGFKRRPPTAPNPTAARRLANNTLSDAIVDRNGNQDTEPLTTNVAPTPKSTPRLMPPKKEGIATRVNRFGFRQPPNERINKVTGLNVSMEVYNGNNRGKIKSDFRSKMIIDSNRNRMTNMAFSPPQAEKYMLQSTHLPRPEPVRVIETKTAKTLANNSKRNAYQEDSSKDSEDSGVGSHFSPDIPPLERLNSSPTYGARRNFYKSRNLEIVKSGNTFDLREYDESPLPQLPSAFTTNSGETLRGIYNSGFVREKAREYQRHLDDKRRKISVTSSEGFSDDYIDEEKTLRDRFKTEKNFIKSKFVKVSFNDSSSDEHDWIHGGEAMADEVSISLSSSDESREPDLHIPQSNLSFEDPKFAAVAAITNTSLLEDETSPVDSLLSCTESEELLKRKLNSCSSNSKDINEKLTPPSPGTPTNNSLSLSDNKDDFLIDDEIADQPGLLCEDTLVANDNTFNSESSPTVIDSTPKPKRRSFLLEGSPLSLRKRNYHSRAGSLDTLSPCESIASDDLMMDYDYSQSSGVEDDRHDDGIHGFCSLDETVIRKGDKEEHGALRNWASLLGQKSLRSTANNSRLIWSRTGTPNSIPDSPKSIDSRNTTRSRHSITNSPLRLGKLVDYESDDSIRLDRVNHSAMKQDIMSMKTMLLKLRRVLNEPDEEILLRSDTHIPLPNGLFNGLNDIQNEESNDNTLELAELRRQILFLQGQLEDKEKIVMDLQEQMFKLSTDNYTSNSAPASTILTDHFTCNAATQTERIRPISAGPNLSPDGANIGSLVSASESPQQRRSRPIPLSDPPIRATKLWRKPGEPPSPQRYTSIPRRATSRTRTPPSFHS